MKESSEIYGSAAAAECTAAACRKSFGDAAAAILATEEVLRSGLYQHALEDVGVPYLTPEPAEQEAIAKVICDGVRAGQDPELWIDNFLFAIDSLSRRGAYYFILASAELSTAAGAVRLRVPAIDPAEELARSAVRHCGYDVK